VNAITPREGSRRDRVAGLIPKHFPQSRHTEMYPFRGRNSSGCGRFTGVGTLCWIALRSSPLAHTRRRLILQPSQDAGFAWRTCGRRAAQKNMRWKVGRGFSSTTTSQNICHVRALESGPPVRQTHVGKANPNPRGGSGLSAPSYAAGNSASIGWLRPRRPRPAVLPFRRGDGMLRVIPRSHPRKCRTAVRGGRSGRRAARHRKT